jgi:hypothetical protein
MGCEGVDYIRLVQEVAGSWEHNVNLRVGKWWEISWPAEPLLASQGEVCFIWLVSYRKKESFWEKILSLGPGNESEGS